MDHGLAHAILVLIAYAQNLPLKFHADVFSRARGSLILCLSLYLDPYFMYASSEGSGESVNWRRLV